jgi:hypothetical protein
MQLEAVQFQSLAWQSSFFFVLFGWLVVGADLLSWKNTVSWWLMLI